MQYALWLCGFLVTAHCVTAPWPYDNVSPNPPIPDGFSDIAYSPHTRTICAVSPSGYVLTPTQTAEGTDWKVQATLYFGQSVRPYFVKPTIVYVKGAFYIIPFFDTGNVTTYTVYVSSTCSDFTAHNLSLPAISGKEVVTGVAGISNYLMVSSSTPYGNLQHFHECELSTYTCRAILTATNFTSQLQMVYNPYLSHLFIYNGSIAYQVAVPDGVVVGKMKLPKPPGYYYVTTPFKLHYSQDAWFWAPCNSNPVYRNDSITVCEVYRGTYPSTTEFPERNSEKVTMIDGNAIADQKPQVPPNWQVLSHWTGTNVSCGSFGCGSIEIQGVSPSGQMILCDIPYATFDTCFPLYVTGPNGRNLARATISSLPTSGAVNNSIVTKGPAKYINGAWWVLAGEGVIRKFYQTSGSPPVARAPLSMIQSTSHPTTFIVEAQFKGPGQFDHIVSINGGTVLVGITEEYVWNGRQALEIWKSGVNDATTWTRYASEQDALLIFGIHSMDGVNGQPSSVITFMYPQYSTDHDFLWFDANAPTYTLHRSKGRPSNNNPASFVKGPNGLYLTQYSHNGFNHSEYVEWYSTHDGKSWTGTNLTFPTGSPCAPPTATKYNYYNLHITVAGKVVLMQFLNDILDEGVVCRLTFDNDSLIPTQFTPIPFADSSYAVIQSTGTQFFYWHHQPTTPGNWHNVAMHSTNGGVTWQKIPFSASCSNHTLTDYPQVTTSTMTTNNKMMSLTYLSNQYRSNQLYCYFFTNTTHISPVDELTPKSVFLQNGNLGSSALIRNKNDKLQSVVTGNGVVAMTIPTKGM